MAKNPPPGDSSLRDPNVDTNVDTCQPSCTRRAFALPRSNPGSGTRKIPANAGLFCFLAVHSRTNPAKACPQKGVARPDTGPWQDRLAAVGRSSNGRANRVWKRVWTRRRAQPGRSVNYARRQQYRRLSHAGKAAPGSVIVGLLGLAVAMALGELLVPRPSGWVSMRVTGSRSLGGVGRRALGGLGAARARSASGGGLAASALAALAGRWRHRFRGDRANRGRRCHRDEDEDLREASPRPRARPGGVAVATLAKMVTQRCAWRHVPRPCARRRARRSRRPGRLDRPLDPGPSCRGRGASEPAFIRLIEGASQPWPGRVPPR